MSDREKEMMDPAAADPPDDQPGGNEAMSLDSSDDSSNAVDPPDDQPGGGQERVR